MFSDEGLDEFFELVLRNILEASDDGVNPSFTVCAVMNRDLGLAVVGVFRVDILIQTT